MPPMPSSLAQLEMDKTRLVEYVSQHEDAVSQKNLREHFGWTGEQFSAALRDLLEQNRVAIFRGSTNNELMVSLSTKGLSDGFARVLQEIRRSGRSGIDQAALMEVLRMPRTEITKALRALVSQRYIQERRSFTNRAKKMYLLFNLEPSTQVTGGSLYCGEELDVHLVDSLRSVIASFVYKKGVASLLDIQQFMDSVMVPSSYGNMGGGGAMEPSMTRPSGSASASPPPNPSVAWGGGANVGRMGGGFGEEDLATGLHFPYNNNNNHNHHHHDHDAGSPHSLAPSVPNSSRSSSGSHVSDLRDICDSPISIVASATNFPTTASFHEGSVGLGRRQGPGGEMSSSTSPFHSFPSSTPPFRSNTLMSLKEYQQQRQQEFFSSAAKALTSKQINAQEVANVVRTLVLDGVLDESFSRNESRVLHHHPFSSSSVLDMPLGNENGRGGYYGTANTGASFSSRQDVNEVPHNNNNNNENAFWIYSIAVGKNVLQHFSAVPRVPSQVPPPPSSSSSSSSSHLVDLEEAITTFFRRRKRRRRENSAVVKKEKHDDDEDACEDRHYHHNHHCDLVDGHEEAEKEERERRRKREWLYHLICHVAEKRASMIPSPLTERYTGENKDMLEEGERNTVVSSSEGRGELQGWSAEDGMEWSYMGAVGYPCLGCPLLPSCHSEGVINPTDCVYLREWMD